MVVAFRSPGFDTVNQGALEMAEGNRTDWRQLCAAAAKETDSEKLAEVVHQLIRALDERGDGFASPTQFDKHFKGVANGPVELPTRLAPSVPE
jgi:hypothetical protein